MTDSDTVLKENSMTSKETFSPPGLDTYAYNAMRMRPYVLSVPTKFSQILHPCTISVPEAVQLRGVFALARQKVPPHTTRFTQGE